MIQPDELKGRDRLKWSTAIGTDVWELFCAAVDGDAEAIIRLVTKHAAVLCTWSSQLSRRTSGGVRVSSGLPTWRS